MAGHYEIKITCPARTREILIPSLTLLGYEGFLEKIKVFYAYIPEDVFNERELVRLLAKFSNENTEIKFSFRFLPGRNWNKTWEQQYLPVFIEDKYQIRAPFHHEDKRYLKSFVISPKMAFGTGHHETTSGMIRIMDKISFKGKNVLDYGTGTGILAIFSEYFGAVHTVAIDNDPAAIECTHENIENNNCHNITVLEGDLDMVLHQKFDIILANINRNILLNAFADFNFLLAGDSDLILSGFYINDLEAVGQKAKKYKFQLISQLENNNWAAVHFKK
jgi:ribosomal protein L11 methyltransferase